MKLVTNVDWLELYCDNTNFKPSPRYQWQQLPYTTRVYRDVWEVYHNDTLYATYLCTPLSAKSNGGVIQDNACHIKLANYWLYKPNFVNTFREFLLECGLTVKCISRLDLCGDFQYFINGLAAKTFIKKYAANDYSKLGAPKGRLYFTDADVKVYNSMSFGSPKSDVLTRMYNKSQELAEVKDKYYIREQWMAAGLDVTKQVWRVEFAIKSHGTHSVDKTTGLTLDVSLNDIDTPQGIHRLFHIYAQHYFRFVPFAEGESKYKQTKLRLFEYTDYKLSPIDNNRMEVSVMADKKAVKYLLELNRNKAVNQEERHTAFKTALTIMRKCHLYGWALQKGYLSLNDIGLAQSVINPYMTEEETETFIKYKQSQNKL